MFYTFILILSQLLFNFALISNIYATNNRNGLDTQISYCSNNILKYNLIDSNDKSVLAIKEQKLLVIKQMQTKEIINELNNNGVETKSIMDRFQLENLLTNIHTIQEIKNKVKLKNQKKDKGREAYYLYMQLRKLENVEFNIIINEIMKRNLSCNPMIEERRNLEVLLAKDIISTNIDIAYTDKNDSLITDAFNIGNKLYNATIKQGNDIINDLQALTTTSYEKDAMKFIKYGYYNATESLCFNESSSSNEILSKNQYLEETIQYLYTLPAFDNIISWAKSKNRDTIIELLLYLNLNNIHQYSTFSSLSAQLADTIMIEKRLFGISSSSLEEIQPNIKNGIINKTIIKDDEYKLNNRNKQIYSKRKAIDSFSIEKDLYDSFNKKLGINIANLIVKLENSLLYGFGKLFYGLQHSKDLIKTGFLKSLVVFFKIGITLITDVMIQIAQWSGSQILTTSQTLTIVCGYTILTKKGIVGLSSAFIFTRLIFSILHSNSPSAYIKQNLNTTT